jgi:hypothetical protein
MMTRRRWTASFAISVWLVAAVPAVTWPPAAQAFPPSATEARHMSYAEPGVLVVFVRTGRPHCADAKVFLADYARDHAELRIIYRTRLLPPNWWRSTRSSACGRPACRRSS